MCNHVEISGSGFGADRDPIADGPAFYAGEGEDLIVAVELFPTIFLLTSQVLRVHAFKQRAFFIRVDSCLRGAPPVICDECPLAGAVVEGIKQLVYLHAHVERKRQARMSCEQQPHAHTRETDKRTYTRTHEHTRPTFPPSPTFTVFILGKLATMEGSRKERTQKMAPRSRPSSNDFIEPLSEPNSLEREQPGT